MDMEPRCGTSVIHHTGVTLPIEGLPMTRVSYSELAEQVAGGCIIVTTGFSELGYQFPGEVEGRVERLVAHAAQSAGSSVERLFLVSGGTRDGGICDITYGTADALKKRQGASRRLEIVTVGLASATAQVEGVGFHDVDLLCLVEPLKPGSWEVAAPNGRSLTVDLVTRARCGLLVAFRGGAVTAKELGEAIETSAICIVHQGDAFRPNPQKVVDSMSKLEADHVEAGSISAQIAERVYANNIPRGIYIAGKRVSTDPDALEALPNFDTARTTSI